MKNLILIFILFFISFQTLKAQKENRYVGEPYSKNSKFHQPVFCDSNSFMYFVKNKLDLKKIYDEVKSDTSQLVYSYIFAINEKGKVEPRYYSDSVEYKKIYTYITDVFNKYKWKPGYKKHCQSCKAKLFLNLTIFFDTFNNNVTVKIETIEYSVESKNILSFAVPYKELKSFID